MDSRRYPRVQLPLLVALKHPSLGSLRCIAKDISEGGVYVYTDNPHIGPGAKVKVTLENLLNVESQPTPTVEMEVKRVEAEGLALEFVNVTGRHLWQSVERLRTELAVGRDLFQAHLNIVVTNETGVLLTQRHGRWGFPGHVPAGRRGLARDHANVPADAIRHHPHRHHRGGGDEFRGSQ